MGLFKNIFKWGAARTDEAAEKIENSDPIGFAKQEIKEIEEQKNAARSNVGKMKAQILGVKRELKDDKADYENSISKAKQLKAAGKMELATKLAERAAEIQESIDAHESSLKALQSNLEKQQRNFETLDKTVKDAHRELKTMKSMEQVTKSTEALAAVDLEGSESALSKFKSRKSKIQARLDEAEAMADTKGVDLDAEADKALGTPSKGAALLDTL